MILIPVVDLLRGQVVRAVAGNRSTYRPIVSRLCEGSDPLTVARALCEHCASSQLYLADLDALQGGQVQLAPLRMLLQAMPDLQLWLDAGFADAAAAEALRSELGALAERVVFVFGSESLRSREALAQCFDSSLPGSASRVLSLDRRDGQRLDAAGCWEAVELWPQRVIVMTLERVGSGAGPDLDTLRELRSKAPGAMLVGAGGIRDEADLARAQEAGADAWLVASALHDGRLPRRIG
jgi:phosphoribosylformimino-5-aminoimidazole carboxamide ribotide isomerase